MKHLLKLLGVLIVTSQPVIFVSESLKNENIFKNYNQDNIEYEEHDEKENNFFEFWDQDLPKDQWYDKNLKGNLHKNFSLEASDPIVLPKFNENSKKEEFKRNLNKIKETYIFNKVSCDDDKLINKEVLFYEVRNDEKVKEHYISILKHENNELKEFRRINDEPDKKNSCSLITDSSSTTSIVTWNKKTETKNFKYISYFKFNSENKKVIGASLNFINLSNDNKDNDIEIPIDINELPNFSRFAKIYYPQSSNFKNNEIFLIWEDKEQHFNLSRFDISNFINDEGDIEYDKNKENNKKPSLVATYKNGGKSLDQTKKISITFNKKNNLRITTNDTFKTFESFTIDLSDDKKNSDWEKDTITNWESLAPKDDNKNFKVEDVTNIFDELGRACLTLFVISDIDKEHKNNTCKKTSIYFLEDDNKDVKLTKLIDLKKDYVTNKWNNKNNEIKKVDNIYEPNEYTGICSFYDDNDKKNNFAISTNNSVFLYSFDSFNNIKNNATYKKILFLNDIIPPSENDNNPNHFITKNSLTFLNNKIEFLLGSMMTSDKNIIGKINKKYNLSDLKSSNFKYECNDQLNDANEFIKNIEESIKKDLQEGNKSQVLKTSQEYFQKAFYNSHKKHDEFTVKIDDNQIENLIPKDKFGKLTSNGVARLQANNVWYSRFSNENKIKIDANFNRRFNLSNLSSLTEGNIFKVWEEGYHLDKYDDFNNIVGWVYNEIQKKLEKIKGFEDRSKYVMWKESHKCDWEINDWRAKNNGSEWDSKGWGFTSNDNELKKLIEDKKVELTLKHIKVRVKKSDNELFYISNENNKFKNEYVKLPDLKVTFDISKSNFKDIIDNNITNLEKFNNGKNKLNLEEKRKTVENLQFNGIGLTTKNTIENRLKIQDRLNKHLDLEPGLGISLINIEDNNYYTFNKTCSKLKVRLFDRAFVSLNSNDANEIEKDHHYNYITIEIKLYGLNKENSLPGWIMPFIFLGAAIILILTIALGWFIYRKRHYKQASNREMAAIAREQRRQEKLANKNKKN